jgi:diacylglycerol kinase
VTVISPTPEPSIPGSVPAPPRPRRRWKGKFGDAFRGLKLGVRGHSSFSVHFFFAALVVVTAIILRCAFTEWCLLIGCIGFVLTAELFNSAIENLCRAFDDSAKPGLRASLDIAAGAVLVASICAALIGALVLLRSLAALLFPDAG